MKKFIPVIAKIIKNRVQTNITLVIDGIEFNNEFTTSFNPSFRLIILRGLNALNTLRALSALSALRVLVFEDVASTSSELPFPS